MSEVKTAAAWGRIMYDDIDDANFLDNRCASAPSGMPNCVPVTIVYGATESDILAGLSLLAKSREVCEWREHNANNMSSYTPVDCGGNLQYDLEKPNFCQSCGLRVEVKE